MKIKKMYQGTAPENKIVGTYTESNSDAYTCNYSNGNFNKKIVYSNNEFDTGKVWIDGKKIYGKVISTTSPSSSNAWVSIASVSNLDTLVNMYGFLIGADGRKMFINHPEPSAQISTSFLNGNVEMRLSLDNWKNRTVYLTLEYTKSS